MDTVIDTAGNVDISKKHKIKFSLLKFKILIKTCKIYHNNVCCGRELMGKMVRKDAKVTICYTFIPYSKPRLIWLCSPSEKVSLISCYHEIR